MKFNANRRRAEDIASKHMKVDPEITQVFLARDEKEIKIVEVTNSVSTTKQIIPFRLENKPDHGIHIPCFIVLLSPEELELLKQNDLDLPEGWGKFNELTLIGFNKTETKTEKTHTHGQKRRRVG